MAKSALPSDHHIVYLLRLQQIFEKFEFARASFTQPRRMEGYIFETRINEYSATDRLEVLPFVGHWRHVLESYWETVPNDAKTLLLRIQYDYAMISLHEVCLEETLFKSSIERLQVRRWAVPYQIPNQLHNNPRMPAWQVVCY
jgi:hypothetical protein